jgi:type IV pilus assembly protein PilA
MNAGKTNRRGFTLVEIMIVVVIIGLLAAMAIPAFERVRQASQNSRLANDFRSFAGAADTFMLEKGYYPEDSASGDVPAGFGEYIKEAQWTGESPIGGDWDFEKDSFGITSGFGVHGFTVDDAQLLRFDEKQDDGNLSTGSFRKIAGDRYYQVLVE